MSETTAPLPSAASAGSRTPTAGRRRARIALRGLEVLLALFYGIASALPKLIAHPSAAEGFDKLGWGDTGMYAIGVLELAGAIALLIPVLRSVAAVSLGALMVGAFIVTIVALDGENAATPLILLVPLGLIAWARRESVKDLARLVRRTP
ncbi:DoxX family protein [Streptomyces sp. ID05-39B]|uniref:DoxX family protein n=1 Tax=Streptomyces sp. ID05-39B TaxID=3028664 RepID=UPI0029A5FF8C|nr:DoxX family protein [Streptomyces sp. ID05-39B]MDX3531246.1 DoxX family protein [Streptomyces sp. ID05-39B]